jgi:hypothetical protein
MKLRSRTAILLGAIVLLLGTYLTPRAPKTLAISGSNRAENSETLQRETLARSSSALPGGEAHYAAPADIAARDQLPHTGPTDGSLLPEEMAAQLLGEFGHLPLTATQFAQLAPLQQIWIGMRRDLAASMAQHEKRDQGDVADLQVIDHTRDSALRRIFGEEIFRLWVASRDVNHRAFQSDPLSIGLDAERTARIYAAIREHAIATTTLPSDEQMHLSSSQSADRPVSSLARVALVAQTEVTLGTLLGREPFERMQRQGLFGLPDLHSASNDSHLPAQFPPTPSSFPSLRNP